MRKLKSLYSFFLSYIIILVIPLAIGIIVYPEIIDIVEIEERKFNLHLLEKAQDTLDNAMMEIDRMVISLGNDSFVRRFAILKNPIVGTSTYYLYELERRLTAYYERNRFAHSFYIYSRNSDSIFMQSGFYKANRFYNEYFTYNNMDYEEWRELFLEKANEKTYLPTVPVVIEPITFNMLTSIQSFPGVYKEDPSIVIWVLIDEELIIKLLSNISSDGCALIVDEKNQIIASTAGTENIFKSDISLYTEEKGYFYEVIDNQKVIITYISSEYKPWKYISVVPYNMVIAKTNFIRWMMIIIGVFIFIFGLITAYLLARRSARPLMEIVNMVKEKIPSNSMFRGNEYDFIKTNVKEITELNKSLETEMQQQIPILHAAFIERLIKGEYTTETEIQNVQLHLGITIKADFFSVIIIHINSFDNLLSDNRLKNILMAKLVIKNLISRKHSDYMLVHDKTEDTIVLIMKITAQEAGKYKKIAKTILLQIYNILLSGYSVYVSFSAGRLYPKLAEVWHSYGESLEALETMRVNKDFGINWYEEQSESKMDYYYPLDIEERLLNNVKAGNKKEVSSILDIVYKENIENRKLAAEMLRFLLNNMCCTIIKVLRQGDLNRRKEKAGIIERVKCLRRTESFNDAYVIIGNIYEEICGIVDSMKTSHNKGLITDIKVYLNSVYSDPCLNLYAVGSKFDMSEVYLSSFFKEQAGINFSDFLEEIRLGKACELLLSRENSINSIAAATGYGSVKAFSRAFKRVKGVAPSDYRKFRQ